MFKPLLAALALSLAPAAAQAIPTFGHYSPPAEYGSVTSSFYLPMRDGVRIAVRVTRPARDGKAVDARFPVIWHGTLSISQESTDGTGSDLSATRAMPGLVKWGYVVVQVARRGNGQSFGERRGYHDRNEAQDAYDITQWLAAQPWSDGKVGVYGCSNTGDAAMHALTMRPPALKAAFAGCFSWHKYDAFRRGGIFAQWGTGPTRTVAEEMQVEPVDGDTNKTLLAQAVADHQRSTPLFALWKSMPFRDSFAPSVASRFWAEGSAASYQNQIREGAVPLYIMGGWFDELRDQGLIAHMNLPGSRVVIGPWKHCENDAFAMLEEMHRFFDATLKGMDTGFASEKAIHYFTMNAPAGAEWRSTDVWPIAGTRMTNWYLGGRQLFQQPRDMATIRFTADYSIACPEAGSGSRIQPCHRASAGPSFAGTPLKRDTEVTGNGLADLWIAADGPDANVFAYLEDVAPDGTVRVITEGRLKASLRAEDTAPWRLPAGVPWHRAFAADAQPLARGVPVHLRFDLLPTSWIFKAGHRIQVSITGSDHRERSREPERPPTITLMADRAHSSFISLPFVTT